MYKLANFSIETDNVVLLHFQDGGERRVAVSQLSEHLLGADLARVRAALKLRRDFIKTHLPKMGLMALAVIGLAALLVGGGQVVAQLLHREPAPSSAPQREGIAHMMAPSTPNISPVPSSPAKGKAPTQLVVTSTQSSPSHRSQTAVHQPVSALSRPLTITRVELPLLNTVKPLIIQLPILSDEVALPPVLEPSNSVTDSASTSDPASSPETLVGEQNATESTILQQLQ